MDNTELFPKNNDRIVCVKVGKVIRENLYEMARKYNDHGVGSTDHFLR